MKLGARVAVAVAAVAVGALAACRPARPPAFHPEAPAGRWYVIGPSETIDDVARAAGVPVEDLLELNGIERAQARPGKLLFVMAPSVAVPGASAGGGDGTPGTGGAGTLRWPLDERPLLVGSPFGARGGRPHDGIDLPAPMGTPIYAAGAGRVIYAGDAIRGYGNMVVVQHPGDLLTVYAHASALLVREGEAVAQGHKLALVGQSGRASGPHLHFEVRQAQIPRDPMLYLPALSPSSPGSSR